MLKLVVPVVNSIIRHCRGTVITSSGFLFYDVSFPLLCVSSVFLARDNVFVYCTVSAEIRSELETASAKTI